MSPGAMEDAEFTTKLKAILECGECGQKKAAAAQDQQMSTLFLDYAGAGWTQEKIAERVGAVTGKAHGQQWVGQHLRFGKFLAFTTSGSKGARDLASLTERHFRRLWSQAGGGKRGRPTAESEAQDQRTFAEVLRLWESEEEEAPREVSPAVSRQTIGDAVFSAFTVGKPLSFRTILSRAQEKVPGLSRAQVQLGLHRLMKCPPRGFLIRPSKASGKAIEDRQWVLEKVPKEAEKITVGKVLEFKKQILKHIADLESLGTVGKHSIPPSALTNIAAHLKRDLKDLLEDAE